MGILSGRGGPATIASPGGGTYSGCRGYRMRRLLSGLIVTVVLVGCGPSLRQVSPRSRAEEDARDLLEGALRRGAALLDFKRDFRRLVGRISASRWEALARGGSGEPERTLYMAMGLDVLGARSRALDFLEELRIRHPGLRPVHAALHEVHTARTDIVRALEAARRGVDRFPGDAGLWLRKAQSEIQLGRYADARSSAREAARADPDDPSALQVLGDIAIHERAFSDAEKVARDGLVRWPENEEFTHLLAQALRCQARFEEARPLYEGLVRDEEGRPEWVVYLRELADLHMFTESYLEAANAYRLLIEGGADTAAVRGNLAAALLGLGELDRAEEVARGAIQMSQRTGRENIKGLSMKTLAGVERRRGRDEEALRLLRDAIRSNPGIPEAYLWIGEICEAKGDRVNAIAAYENLLTLVGRMGVDAEPVTLYRYRRLLGSEDPRGAVEARLDHLRTEPSGETAGTGGKE